MLQVTVVGENVNKGLLEQAGMQAAVPTIAKVQAASNLGFQGANSVDAVVSLGAIASLSAVQRNMFVQVRWLRLKQPLTDLKATLHVCERIHTCHGITNYRACIKECTNICYAGSRKSAQAGQAPHLP